MTDIVVAGAEHISDILKTEQECFSAPWTENLISNQIEKEDSLFLVALADGQFAGYISGDIVVGEVYINNIAVRSEFRGRGIGQALLKDFIGRLCDNDLITLEVRVGNTPARRLYEKCGFVNLGERKNFYHDPVENACIYTLYLKEG